MKEEEIPFIQIKGKGKGETNRAAQPNESRRDEYAAKCRTCGACCSYFSVRPHGIPVKRGRLAVNTALTFRRAVKIAYHWPDVNSGIVKVVLEACAWMRRRKRNGWWQCVAFRGHVGQTNHCSIYQTRPAVCRNFDPGSEKCVAARTWAGLEKPAEVAA